MAGCEPSAAGLAGGDNRHMSDGAPESFRAFVVEREGEVVRRGVRPFRMRTCRPAT